mgnify:CR=1 FL=1
MVRAASAAGGGPASSSAVPIRKDRSCRIAGLVSCSAGTKSERVRAARTAYAAGSQSRDVVVYRITGAFFFGATATVNAVLDRIGEHPRVFVLDMSEVPLVDSTAARALEVFAEKLGASGTTVYIAGARTSVRRTLLAAGLKRPLVHYAASAEDAVEEAHKPGGAAA